MVSDVYKMTNRKMISSSFLSACRFRRLAFDVVNLDRPILLQNVGDLSGIPDRYHLKMTEVDVFPGNPLYVDLSHLQVVAVGDAGKIADVLKRSEEHTSELQSLA